MCRESVLNTCMISFNLLFQPKCCLNYVLKYYYMEIDRLLLSPAFYYRPCYSGMPVSLTAWLCLKMYTSVEHDLCPTCYERPPVLSDRFCLAEGVVAQDRFYCMVVVAQDRFYCIVKFVHSLIPVQFRKSR